MTMQLRVPPSFPLAGLVTDLAAEDTMYEGGDDHYLAVGLSALRCIESAVSGSPGRILDLPCGFGRVTRVLRARYPSAQITVCDLDRHAVDFAAAHFGARGVYSVEDLAELDLVDVFDLIWVGSLVTHLSEAQTRAFLQAMHRAMMPEATMVVTSHGPTIADGLKSWCYGLEPSSAAAVLDDYAAAGYGHRGYGGGGGYGISLTDRHWWEMAAIDHGFELSSYRVQGWDNHQDVLVFKRRTDHARAADAPCDAAAVREARRRVAEYDGRLAQFDTSYYLSANPDVAAGIAEGHVTSAYEHYRLYGRLEGRPAYSGPTRPTAVPPNSVFDQVWYLRAFPDVAAAVTKGVCLSAYDHWLDTGRAEGRPPHG